MTVATRPPDEKAPGEPAPPAGNPAPVRGGGLAGRAIWASLDTWTQQIFQLLTFVFVGRVIGPEQVGIFGFALLYFMLMYSFLMQSYTEALVQRKELTEAHRSSVFWLSLLFGIGLSGAGFLTAPLISRLFRMPEVEPVLIALAAVYPALAASSVYVDLMRRALKFRALALRTFLSVGVASVVAIYAVTNGYGYWSLVYYHLTWRLVELFSLAALSGWFPRPMLSPSSLAELRGVALNALGLRVLGYFTNSADRLLIGAFLGPLALGLYTMANRMVAALTEAVTGVVNNLTLAVLPRLQGDRERFMRAFEAAAQLSNLVGLPIFVGLAAVAPTLIAATLGPEWQPMTPIVQLLSLRGAIFTISYVQGSSLRALGEMGLVLKLSAWFTALRLSAIAVAAPFGAVAVAAASAIAPVLISPVWQFNVRKRIGVGYRRLYGSLLPAFWSAAAMLIGVLLTGEYLGDLLSRPVLLGIQVAGGGAVYIMTLLLTSPRSLRLVLAFARARTPN